MKSWAWALGASLALHALLLLWAVRPAALPLPEGERVGERANQKHATFTAVSLVPRANLKMLEPPASPAPAPPPSPRPSAAELTKALEGVALGTAVIQRLDGPGRRTRDAGAAASADDELALLPDEQPVLAGLHGVTLAGGTGLSARAALGEKTDADDSAGGGLGSGPPPSPLGATGGPIAPSGTALDVTPLVHARLAAAADRCYPAAARRFQQRGTVELAFCISTQGAAERSRVTHSSGSNLLDAAAQDCVLEGAAPFPPETASRCFTVPVRFGAR